MKIIKNIFPIVSAFLASPNLSQASVGRYGDYGVSSRRACIQETWILMDSRTQMVGPCMDGMPLLLASTKRTYPLLNNASYPVEYWQGSFVKDRRTTNIYRHEVFDECSSRLILSKDVSEVQLDRVEFAIDNPNLKDSVSATYQLLPMTDDEAKIALHAARISCENKNVLNVKKKNLPLAMENI